MVSCFVTHGDWVFQRMLKLFQVNRFRGFGAPGGENNPPPLHIAFTALTCYTVIPSRPIPNFVPDFDTVACGDHNRCTVRLQKGLAHSTSMSLPTHWAPR